jgi:hypothetical protein
MTPPSGHIGLGIESQDPKWSYTHWFADTACITAVMDSSLVPMALSNWTFTLIALPGLYLRTSPVLGISLVWAVLSSPAMVAVLYLGSKALQAILWNKLRQPALSTGFAEPNT